MGDAVEDTGGFNSMVERLACQNLFPEHDTITSRMPSVSITIWKHVVVNVTFFTA